MNTEAIELICEKLGTTINELVPTVISYGLYSARVWSTGGLVALIVGVYLLFKARQMRRSGKYTWADDAPDIIIIIGIIIIISSLTVLGFNLWSLHMWRVAPNLTAYKEIAGWFR